MSRKALPRTIHLDHLAPIFISQRNGRPRKHAARTVSHACVVSLGDPPAANHFCDREQQKGSERMRSIPH